MLSPESRSLYIDALSTPPGMIFDRAIATTYSLDLTTLLCAPLQVMLSAGESVEQMLGDGVALLQTMRRSASRFTVYCQQGQIRVPERHHLLYGVLEEMVHEVTAPRGGVFHPKIWLLRFTDPDGDAVRLRLLILSRNLTRDRSWDVSLMLEGEPTDAPIPANEPLHQLLRTLPDMTIDGVNDERRAEGEQLAKEVLYTEWSLPDGFDSITFHVLGFDERTWVPPESSEMVVFSPFVSGHALERIAATTHKPLALVSREDQLAELGEEAPGGFCEYWTLHEAAQGFSEEEEDELAPEATELHAKLYLLKRGWHAHIILGSANATNAALMNASNVEILADLVGRYSRVGMPADILKPQEQGGMGSFLVPFDWTDEVPVPDPEKKAAQDALENARSSLMEAGLNIQCYEVDETWRLRLHVKRQFKYEGVNRIDVWPVTIRQEFAVPADHLKPKDPVDLGQTDVSFLTGLIVFELEAEITGDRDRFVLNLPVFGMPAERDGAILRTVVQNRDGFLRYLLLLLGDLGEDEALSGPVSVAGAFDWNSWGSSGEELALIEDMVRALSRDPDRLDRIAEFVRDVTEDGLNEELVPGDFLEIWNAFEKARREVGR